MRPTWVHVSHPLRMALLFVGQVTLGSDSTHPGHQVRRVIRVELRVTQAHYEPIEQRPIEIVERKGLGHPDTICDSVAEELSRELCCYYLSQFGQVLHHNVDKALLVGGRTEVGFGGGVILEPMRLILSGRATSQVDSKYVPVGALAIKAAREWLRANLPDLPDEGVIVDYHIKPGSAELINVVEGNTEVPLANDTSLGVSHAPLSETERLVLEAERVVREVGRVGADVKIMALRHDHQVELTIAAALVASRTPNVEAYEAARAEIVERVSALSEIITGRRIIPCVNCADQPEKESYYLTVTGTSAEHGDDGQVGRGNRINGLITPFRPMSMEAVAGKNPVSHIGKIYNRMAEIIANRIVELVPGAEVACYMLSQIGKPINDPMIVHIEVAGVEAGAVSGTATEVVEEVLSRWREIQEEFVRGGCRVA
ncbi:MAG: methionine adenosyltransferase [Armatimonadetes bacterium]|nr:methionine adenosyltransferase [Armatimonadota bacterium]